MVQKPQDLVRRNLQKLCSTITIPMHYTKCHVQLLVNQNISHSAGFKVQITYSDGYGSARKPRTGADYTVKDITGIFDEYHLGMKPNIFTLDAKSAGARAAFLASVKDFIDLDKEVAAYDEEDKAYRARLGTDFESKRHILANQFWYRVYNDETNEFLRKFPDEHKESLDYLYERTEFIDKTDSSRLWYCFWDDFWSQNKNMGIVREHAKLFDVSQSSALCYRTADRTAMEKWLFDVGVMASSCSYKQLISKNTLDLLFDRAFHPEKYPLKEYLTPVQVKLNALTGKAALQNQLSTVTEKGFGSAGNVMHTDSTKPSASPTIADIYPSSLASDQL
jgi:hypothetical protein